MESKYKHQMKHIKDNYVKMATNLRPEVFEAFKKACYENGTTPATEVKRFIDEYLESHNV